MPCGADGGEIPVEVLFVPRAGHVGEFVRRQHHHLFVGRAFALAVGILDDAVPVRLHHLGKTQHFSREGTMRIRQGRNGVKNTDEVKRRFCHESLHAKVIGCLKKVVAAACRVQFPAALIPWRHETTDRRAPCGRACRGLGRTMCIRHTGQTRFPPWSA